MSKSNVPAKYGPRWRTGVKPTTKQIAAETTGAATIQGALQGHAVRQLMELPAIVTRNEDDIHGEFLLELVWLTPVLGVRLIARGGDLDKPHGVIVSEVTDDCVHASTIKTGMLLEAIDAQWVVEKSFNEVMSILEVAERPLTLVFRATVEHVMLTMVLKQFCMADFDATGILEKHEIAVVLNMMYESGAVPMSLPQILTMCRLQNTSTRTSIS
jgi:hypothetical protein